LLVFNPSATLVHAGKLAATEVDGLADSPLRQKLCKLLADDHAVVWIVREGRDAEANAVADTALKALMADVATGKYRMPDPATADLDDDGLNPPAGPKPSKSDPAPAGDSDANAGGKPIRCAIVKIAVDDRQDPWLLKMLDAVDQDDALPVPPAKAPADEPTEPAADSTDSEKKAAKPAADTGPRVYAIYGRARAMPAIAGKHVTHAVLTECLAYLSGPCSCTIKDENPGVDLLTTWNWEATAEALMKDDPLERARAGGWMVGDEPQPAAGATVAATQAKADASDKTAGEPAVGAAVATPTHTTGVESAQSTRGDEPTVGGVNVLLLAGGGALLAVLLIAVVGTAMLYARRG
jgi:hypothetical protein